MVQGVNQIVLMEHDVNVTVTVHVGQQGTSQVDGPFLVRAQAGDGTVENQRARVCPCPHAFVSDGDHLQVAIAIDVAHTDGMLDSATRRIRIRNGNGLHRLAVEVPHAGAVLLDGIDVAQGRGPCRDEDFLLAVAVQVADRGGAVQFLSRAGEEGRTEVSAAVVPPHVHLPGFGSADDFLVTVTVKVGHGRNTVKTAHSVRGAHLFFPVSIQHDDWGVAVFSPQDDFLFAFSVRHVYVRDHHTAIRRHIPDGSFPQFVRLLVPILVQGGVADDVIVPIAVPRGHDNARLTVAQEVGYHRGCVRTERDFRISAV